MTDTDLFLSQKLTPPELRQVPALALAHLGDSVYELLVRSHLLSSGMTVPNHLHQRTTELVCATAQSDAAELLLPLLDEEESALYRRGRNADVHNIPKNATHAQYNRATALEALFGGLFLLGRNDRIRELFDLIMKEAEHAT